MAVAASVGRLASLAALFRVHSGGSFLLPYLSSHRHQHDTTTYLSRYAHLNTSENCLLLMLLTSKSGHIHSLPPSRYPNRECTTDWP
jgi:hypothetical protein